MKRQSLQLVVVLSLLSMSTLSSALEDQWFAGIGGGTSRLVPNPVNSSIDDSENVGSYGTFYIGRDLGNFSSFQFQFHSLGTAVLTNQEEVDYSAIDASILYRFYDSRDRGFDRDAYGLSIYGRFGLGGMMRDAPAGLRLKNDAEVYFAGGAGMEIYFNRWLALRLEAAYLDEDAAFGGISLLSRFGGVSARGARPPVSNKPDVNTRIPNPEFPAPPVPKPELKKSTQAPDEIQKIEKASEVVVETNADQAPSTLPETSVVLEQEQEQEQLSIDSSESVISGDSDSDQVTDDVDECVDSQRGYPVNKNGCAILNGVLNRVVFAMGTANLLPASFRQLDSLADLLHEYPQARIQVLAHTDNMGSARDQSVLTRARLRTLGTYLVRKGVGANRLILRSLGGSRPAFDNNTEEGRAANNRIELLEFVN